MTESEARDLVSLARRRDIENGTGDELTVALFNVLHAIARGDGPPMALAQAAIDAP